MTTVSGKFIVVMVDAMVLIAFHHHPYKNKGNIPLAWRTKKARAPRLG